VPERQPKKARLWLTDGSCVRLRPEYPNHIRSYDFVRHILSRTATKALSWLLFGSDVLSRTFSHLSFEERKSISSMRDEKFSQSEIARRLGRDRATISREVRRNYWHDHEFSDADADADADADGYWAMTANDMARDLHRRVGNDVLPDLSRRGADPFLI
jgi:hypothetical protein